MMDMTMSGSVVTLVNRDIQSRRLQNARKAEIKRRISYARAFCISILITFLIICSGMVIADAAVSEEVHVDQYKYYTSIQIEKDDTLWSIAGNYVSGTNTTINYINEIKEINHLDSDLIYQGQNLIIYYYSPIAQ